MIRVAISSLITNDQEPRFWDWLSDQLPMKEKVHDDRYIIDEYSLPYTQINYCEKIRAKTFHRAFHSVLTNHPETKEFRPIIVDEFLMVLSGMLILEIYRNAGRKFVDVYIVHGFNFEDKLEAMLDDTENFQKHNWTPKLDPMAHKINPNFRQN